MDAFNYRKPLLSLFVLFLTIGTMVLFIFNFTMNSFKPQLSDLDIDFLANCATVSVTRLGYSWNILAANILAIKAKMFLTTFW